MVLVYNGIESMPRLSALENNLGYTFVDSKLLQRALSHRSVGSVNNERLEFLGDAILGFVIAAELFSHFADADEGQLSRMRAQLVNREMLADLARKLDVAHYLRLGSGEEKSGGGQRPSILADAMEAIIGAIYLDAGLQQSRACVLSWFGDHVESLSTLKPKKDAKSCLQEWAQAQKLPLPHYAIQEYGQPHAKTFTVTCTIVGLQTATTGVSTSRRKAEQIAAQHYLELLDGK